MKVRWRMVAAGCGVAAALAGAAAAWGLSVMMNAGQDVPAEIVVTESDAIVVVTVVDAGKAGEGNETKAAKLQLQREVSPSEARCEVSKVLANASKSELAGKTITVNLNATYGNARVMTGTALVLALKKQGGGADQWYPLPYAKAMSADVEKVGKELEKAADIDKWNWGKPVNGLACVAVARGVTVGSAGFGGSAAVVQVTTGLRNVGKESIWVNIYPVDNVVGLKASWDGTPVPAKAPEYVGGAGQVFDPAYHAAEIKPGAVVWVGPWGQSSNGAGYVVQSPEGKCEVRAGYTSRRDAATAAGAKLWRGSVESGTITVEIPKTSRGGW